MFDNDEERDIIEFTDDEGNTLLLEMLDRFYYNGEEFAVLGDVEEECDCGAHDEDCDHEHSLYIMKIETSIDDDGDEVEEFIPVEEELMEALIEIVQTRYSDDDDDDEEEEEEEDDDDDEDAEDEDDAEFGDAE